MEDHVKPYNPVRELGTTDIAYETVLDPKLSDSAFLTLAFYLYYDQRNLEIPNTAAAAEALGKSIATVSRNKRELIKLGYMIPLPQKGWIYIVQCGDHYKIGKTKNVKRRFIQLQSSMPYPLRLEHQSQHDNVVQVERELHTMFHDKWIRGEWFKLSDEDLAWFKKGIAT